MVTQTKCLPVGIPLELLLEAKGRGIYQSVKPDTLIVNTDTVISNEINVCIVIPTGDKFLVLVKPEAPFKEKQTIIIMSKFVIKSLKAAYSAPKEQVLRNTPRYSEEFQRKWNPSGSR